MCIPIFIGLASCKDDDKTDPQKELSDFVSSLQMPEQEEFEGKQALDTAVQYVDGNKICTHQKYKAGATYDEQLVLSPTSDVIYAGAILDGNSVITGEYLPIIAKRAPLRISTSFVNKEGKVYKDVENVSLSNIRQAEKELMNDVEINGASTSYITFKIDEIESKEEVGIKIGAAGKFGKTAKIEENFEFDKTQHKHSFLVSFTQIYYTIDVDFPGSASAFFDKSVTSGEIQSKMTKKVMPCYVSSVKYGRVAYIALETNEEAKNIKQQLTASFDAWKINVDASTEFERNYNSSTTRIKGTIIGGNAETSSNSIDGIEGIKNFIKQGGNFGKDNPAALIGYKLSCLSNGTTFALHSNTTYTIENCTSYEGGTVQVSSIYAHHGEKGGGDELEPFGKITLKVGSDELVLLNLEEKIILY